MWRTYCGLTSLFPIIDTCLSCEDIARQSCRMVPRWRFLRHFCVLYLQQAACSTFQTCILNSHYGHTMCRSMVNIQSPTAEIRRGKKERKKEETAWNIYIWSALLHRATINKLPNHQQSNTIGLLNALGFSSYWIERVRQAELNIYCTRYAHASSWICYEGSGT